MARFRLLLMGAIGIALPAAASIGAAEAERDVVLKACAAEFGNAVDSNLGLFEVNPLYVLEAKFDDQGQLAQLGVLPKHWFGDEHPEWDEAEDVGELSVAEYTWLLGRLEQIRPKGKVVDRAEWPVVKATTARRRDVYEFAVLVTHEVVDDTRPEDAPRAIKAFIVYFTPEDDP